MKPWTRKTCRLCCGDRVWIGSTHAEHVHVRLRVCPNCDRVSTQQSPDPAAEA